MATSSKGGVYHGATPPKPSHYFSGNPPTPHPIDQQSLRDYRLDRFKNDPGAVALAHFRASNHNDTQATRQATTAIELAAILSRLNQ
ncbi:hypothetical protein F5Y04DRAFT_282826 [Hypomontagnella monticulosa]|nr:hypothetical protein F5Y04DRAFT_282826 [Hypomontagnella monticulosa]